MGAKSRVLDGFLDRVVTKAVPAGGTIVDLMSGTGVVATFCANRYRVLANDVQKYSQVIASSFIEHDESTKEEFLARLSPQRDLRQVYDSNVSELTRRLGGLLDEEDELLRIADAKGADGAWCRRYRAFLERSGAGDFDGLTAGGHEDRAWPFDSALIERYRSGANRTPACLTTAYYGNLYFGLRQAVVIDSIRAAIAELDGEARFASRTRNHYLAALLYAASTSTSGTSHFAQPRHLRKDSELRAMAQRRQSCVWSIFLNASEEIKNSVARTSFRPGNRATARTYSEFFANSPDVSNAAAGTGYVPFEFEVTPDLIYLDPPYTADNYSRFYHVLEVLVTYDYPPLATDAHGRTLRGRYPSLEKRFQSEFCRNSDVEDAFRRVIFGAAGVGSKLVISYSSPTGLLLKQYARRYPGEDPVTRFAALCEEAYQDVSVLRKPMMHSGQGDSNLAIEELLLVCSRSKAHSV